MEKTRSEKRRKTVEEIKAPLGEFMTRLPGVFEEGVLGKLNETDLKLFSWTNKTCRDAVRRWKKDERKARKKMKFKMEELVSSLVSLLEWAWERFPFGAKERWTKEDFIAMVASVGNVELVRCLREVKKCPWNVETCSASASNAHLDILKYYMHENGCP